MIASRGFLSRENNSCMAIIVHPGFPLKPAAPPCQANWNELPLVHLRIGDLGQ